MSCGLRVRVRVRVRARVRVRDRVMVRVRVRVTIKVLSCGLEASLGHVLQGFPPRHLRHRL